MALVGRFCIDRFEAHLATLDGSGKLVAHPHNQRPEPKVPYVAVSEKGVLPQGYMSRVEAEAACKQASKRLCSMTEWRTACAGSRHTTYPYGPQKQANACSSGKKHLLSELFGKNGKAWKYDEHFNNPELLATPGYLDKTGDHELCQSDTGVYDLVGNLHEWVKDTVTDELVEHMEEESVERRKQPWRTGNGVFMGGFFSTGSEHGPGCTFTTIAHEPAYHDYSIGFRCCAEARGLPPREARPKRKNLRKRKTARHATLARKAERFASSSSCRFSQASISTCEVKLAHGHLLPVSQSNAVSTPCTSGFESKRASQSVVRSRTSRCRANTSAAFRRTLAGVNSGLSCRMSIS
jgi:hypothetical protein